MHVYENTFVTKLKIISEVQLSLPRYICRSFLLDNFPSTIEYNMYSGRHASASVICMCHPYLTKIIFTCRALNRLVLTIVLWLFMAAARMILQICFKWKHESAFIIGAAAITSHNGARLKGQNFYGVASELS